MSRIAFFNLAPLALVVTLSTAVVWAPLLRRASAPAPGAVMAATDPASLVDHAGNVFARADYVRIASLSTVADELLLALCEPDRIVAFTGYSARKIDRGYRFAGKPTLEGVKDFERVLALHPRSRPRQPPRRPAPDRAHARGGARGLRSR